MEITHFICSSLTPKPDWVGGLIFKLKELPSDVNLHKLNPPPALLHPPSRKLNVTDVMCDRVGVAKKNPLLDCSKHSCISNREP